MRAPPLKWIHPDDPPEVFPDPARALRDPDGLLAVGGDLSPARLIYAYKHGIFPWYHDDQPILWWSPDPRAVIAPAELHVSRSLARRLRKTDFGVRYDSDFLGVVDACAAPRRQQPEGGTWIGSAMRAAYAELFRVGHAHSIEIFMGDAMVGGVYGVTLGQVFYGESMFSRMTDGSKIALACLAHSLDAWGYRLLDCQVHSEHLTSLGSVLMPRADFIGLLQLLCDAPVRPGAWQNGASP
ncbi:MAG: leucyl/phenylalanyl-tRNA--protein transferase [Bacillota bacterium]